MTGEDISSSRRSEYSPVVIVTAARSRSSTLLACRRGLRLRCVEQSRARERDGRHRLRSPRRVNGRPGRAVPGPARRRHPPALLLAAPRRRVDAHAPRLRPFRRLLRRQHQAAARREAAAAAVVHGEEPGKAVSAGGGGGPGPRARRRRGRGGGRRPGGARRVRDRAVEEDLRGPQQVPVHDR